MADAMIEAHRHFLETHGTLFHGKQVEPDKLVWAMTALAEGLGIHAVARVFEVDPNTVLSWLVEAADHLEAFSRYVLRDVYVEGSDIHVCAVKTLRWNGRMVYSDR